MASQLPEGEVRLASCCPQALPVWSLGWGSKPGEAISKEEVLQVCGNKHIANAMSKVLEEGRVVTGETGGDRHTKTNSTACCVSHRKKETAT